MRQLLRLRRTLHRSQTNRRTTFQFQLASSMPAVAGNSCTAPFNSSCCAAPRAGGNRRSAQISGPQARPDQRPTPTARWCGVPLQSLSSRRYRPALSQEPKSVPPLPFPRWRRQNQPPAQVLDSHLPLLKRPVYISHAHHQPLPTPETN